MGQINPKYALAASREVDLYPYSDPSISTKPAAKRSRGYFVGWRFGVFSGSLSVFVVLVLNLSFTLWTISHRGFADQRGTLHEGDCNRIRKLNTAAHLIINLFSTIILASSNYCMQCLSAPTRAEIDKEHARGTWLDVGISSVRNLRRISRKRAWLWFFLGVSSLPLHLFYNSVIFASTSTNNYVALSVNHAFLEATSLDNVNVPSAVWDVAVDLHNAALSRSLERLNNSACIQAYANDYISGRSNLLLVAADDNSINVPTVFFIESVNNVKITRSGGCVKDMYAWICPNPSCWDSCHSHLSEVLNDASHWKPQHGNGDVEIDYCLSQQTPEHCKLQFSLQIVIVVIAINFLKMILMLYMAFGLNDTPLMTVGDAVASFLNEEDTTTKGCCLISKFDVKGKKLQWQYQGESNSLPAKAWTQSRIPWARAVSRTRWWACGLMILLAITVCAVFLAWGIAAIVGPKDIGSLWNLGLGAISVRTLINWESSGGPSTLVSNVLVANIAQPILSFIYFIYNGIFTCMLAEREWNQFAQKRGGLRISGVSSGSQRSRYFLQLPYRFAIPIMVLSGVLHWLVSQSIFLVALETYDQGQRLGYTYQYSDAVSPDRLTCGFSPIAIMFVIIVAVVMIAFGVGMGMKRYCPGIPVAGSCSVVISAACHVEDFASGSELALKPIKWGVTRSGEEVSADEIGHCAFSADTVTFPEELCLYAGRS